MITEQINSTEGTQVEPTEGLEATQQEKLSPKYAQLARKEQTLRQKEMELKGLEQRLSSLENDYKTRYVPKEEVSKRFSTNFNEAAEEFGLDYDQLTQAVLNQPSPEMQAYTKLEREFKALKAERETEKQTQAEQQTQAYQKAIDNIRSETEQLVETDQEFETIKTMGRVEDVVAHIEKTYKETGKVLKVSEAAKYVEDKLLEDALKVAKLKKVQEKLGAVEEAATPQIPAKPGMPTKTLTNNLTTNRKLSARERAVLAFEGKL